MPESFASSDSAMHGLQLTEYMKDNKLTKSQRRIERQKLIAGLQGHDDGTGIMEKDKMSIMVSLIEDLEDSINCNSKESSKLSKVMIWLTCAVAIGTFLLALVGGIDLCVKLTTEHQQNKPANVSTQPAK